MAEFDADQWPGKVGPPGPEEAILEAALALPASERAAFLDHACGADASLRRLIDALLRAHGRAVAREPASAQPSTRSAGSASIIEQPGDRIGHYKLLQKVGEGGYGVVYMAEQEQPVRRRVALKVIKLGMDTRQVIARFEAERQALAMMDHPNIARVLDAGATESGRPYFVMELVRGIKITDYCDQNNLPTAKRLELFVQVCKAIQHAHQKGIVHRDVKPSNILVTLHDGVPVPKVIDFGIAKATEVRLTDKTLFTALEQFIGTPAYMSPEQAEMSGLDIDTRSDIYSLGVLLYELLTSRVPFEPKELASAGLDEIRRIIREKEPVRPSTRLSRLAAAEQTTVAKRRQVEPPRLIHLVRGDLDWIVMKCLEKDRTRRYETANGLARDIERHLANEPVLARPPSKRYRFEKLVRRNKLAFAAAGAVVGALIIGLGLSTCLFIRERAALRRANSETAKSQQVARLLANMIGGVDPTMARGMDTALLTAILTNASERFSQELTNQPLVEADLRLMLGRTFDRFGRFSNALAQTSEALRLRREHLGLTNEAVAAALANLAAVLFDLGDFAAAEQKGREALAMRRCVLGDQDPQVATSLNNVGLALWRQSKLAEAEQMEREALAIRRKVLPPEHPDIAMSLNSMADLLMARGDFAGAEPMLRDALVLQQKVSGVKHPAVAVFQNNLAIVLSKKGDLEEAQTLHRDTLALRRQIYAKDHIDLAVSLTQLAVVTSYLGDSDAAETLLHEALAMEQRMALEEHAFAADTFLDLGIVLIKKGDFPSAETNLLRALSIRQKTLGPSNSDVAEALDTLSLLKAARGELDEAERLLRAALRMNRQELVADHPDLIPSLLELSWVLRQQHQPAEAETLRQEAVGIGKRRDLSGAQSFTTAACDLADALQAADKSAEGEVVVQDAADFCDSPGLLHSQVRRHLLQHCLKFFEAEERRHPGSSQALKTAEWRKRLAELDDKGNAVRQ